tara:strand:- start:17875 stop:18288 length:414 start_codon:yes stop_codon:yes gene_type:complete
MKKIKQYFVNILCYFFNKKVNKNVFQIDDILGHPEVVKHAKATDKMIKDIEKKHKESRIQRAKSKEHILRKHFGKEVNQKGFYERNDVIDFIMTSYHFNAPKSSSGNYHSGHGHSNHDEHNHSTSHSGGSCGGSSDD